MGIETKIASDVSAGISNKIASTVSIGGGLGVWLTSAVDAIKGNEGLIGILIAAFGLLVQLIMSLRKDHREHEEYRARMLLLEIQIEEEEGIRGD